MKQVLDFLTELSLNNNKEWFDKNRPRYKEVQSVFNAATEQLIDKIGLFDPAVRGVTVKESTYRIYRDIRFSPDKTPYKTHIGAYICPGGKKSGNAGYYFHLEPKNCILAVGLHCPEPQIVKSVREDIFALYPQFQQALTQAKGYSLDFSAALKRVPREFPSDALSGEFLKLKGYDLILNIADDQFLKKNWLDTIADLLHTGKPFNDFMNRAVNYARQEEKDEQGL